MAETTAKKKEKPKDGIYENLDAQSNPFWFQVMVNGKRVTRRGFRTRGEAKKARAQVIADLTKGEYLEPAKMPYADYFQSWLDGRRNIALTSREMYASYFKNHICPSIGDIPLFKLSAQHVDELLNECRLKGLGDEMIKRIFAVVNASLNSAVKKDLIAKNVASKIEKPTVKRKERPIWEVETMRDFLKKSKGESRYWIAAYLAVMTGMRQGEILGLKWSDLDLEKGLIQVRRNLVKNRGYFDDLKTEKSRRTIAISSQIIAALKEQKEKIEAEKWLLGDEYKDLDLVVCSSKGTPATANKVLVAWKRMQEKHKPANEPMIKFHDLRHAHASILLKQGVHPKVVSERLGHSTITITLDTYSHLLPNMQAEAVQKMEELLDLE